MGNHRMKRWIFQHAVFDYRRVSILTSNLKWVPVNSIIQFWQIKWTAMLCRCAQKKKDDEVESYSSLLTSLLDPSFSCYPLVNIQKTMENHHFSWGKTGKPTINGPFSIAMLVYQRVYTSTGDF